MALNQYSAQVKEGLLLVLPEEAEALHLEPGDVVTVQVRTGPRTSGYRRAKPGAERSEPGKDGMSQKPRRISAMGKYAGLLSSEEFARRKQEEIALEDQSLR